jgi:hypothetical protein
MKGRAFRFFMSRKQRQKQHHGPIYKYCIHSPRFYSYIISRPPQQAFLRGQKKHCVTNE